MKIILGSSSPRRKEIMELMGIEFVVDVPNIDEKIDIKSPNEYVKKVVARKGLAVSAKYPHDFVICADTIVVCKNQILGKPVDNIDAKRMIELLSGKRHDVLTAVFTCMNGKMNIFVERTKVFVASLSSDEIDEYITSSEPYDKAGGYGIQGMFGKYIKKIDGDYYNVMGLPLHQTYQRIKEIQDKIE